MLLPCDLGNVLLPRPGIVRFALPQDSAAELSQVRADLDIRVETTAFDDAAASAELPGLQLPAGDYALAWKGKDDATNFHRFAVTAGAEIEVRLPQ